MLITQNHFLEPPNFFQKFLKKKSSKHNIRPLYTADMISDSPICMEKQGCYKTTHMTTSCSYTADPANKIKTYNQPLLYHSKSHTSLNMKVSPFMTPSSSTASSSTTASSTIPPPSIKHNKKRSLTSDIVLRMMDQYLMKKRQQEQLAIRLNRSTSIESPRHRINRALSATRRPLKEHATKRKLSNHALMTEWPYVLTQDNEEQDRMVAQHYLLRTAFGTDFLSPIRSQLHKGIFVLDVGCGPGTWTMEMATAFPKSTFVGIDQCAFFPKDIKPKNCHFRTCGQLVQHHLRLPFPDNSIDYIYQRDMNWGLMGQTWQALLKEYLRVLKPGGWIEVLEQDLEAQSSPENECNMNDELIKGLCLRMQDPYAVHRLPTMLTVNKFENIEAISRSCPLGWDQPDPLEPNEKKETVRGEPPKCCEFSRAMSGQYLFLLKSLRPWLSTVMSLDHKEYDDFIAGLPAQWSHAKTFINWHCFIAQKPHATYCK
ncbi:S-adenosyl-L-methionine-dependent methyltransferase [Sporodiniella umbellata]|nr:S-adenosyl-L-methionine-dependent methyltransferase [Sporodiniella umbellata]